MFSFPKEFDYEYLIINNLITNLSYDEALYSFYNELIHTGICGSSMCITQNFVKYINSYGNNQKILEIGPGASPSFTGDNAYYFDVRTNKELIDWATLHNLPIHNIPAKIHYTSSDGDLSVINDKFDIVFSSHNIEHTIDLIKYINSIKKLLNQNGFFACVVPNKNFTFDYYRKETNIEDIISQNLSASLIHPLNMFLESELYSTHNDCIQHWLGNHGEIPNKFDNINNYINEYNEKANKNIYIDTHRWVFTPESFRFIFNKLYNLGYINMKLIRCYNTPKNQNGFNAIFI